jgi:hypothetical protein
VIGRLPQMSQTRAMVESVSGNSHEKPGAHRAGATAMVAR